ncbi:DUF2316 family protein [Enterococcus hermanniensis]|uniref:DUF2316 family protein n=1 Tax=Enterococcus hermanniensis TaxID=249189 RepID=A0A1L8TPD3_9ENTE|nr:DUF2316 family protein [Enterococcus hermanniensis]OJG46176.1 hypothetical protein RV04_GL001342 [Enterococcus hermanniensis]
MSLTAQQTYNTKKEFQENFERTGLTLEQIAKDLHTSPEVIADTLALNVSRIEDPWVLKNYLEAVLHEKNITGIPFSALVGDYHHHWFLNSHRIEKRKIG